MANFEDSTGEYTGKVVVDASIVLGSDHGGEREKVAMEGMVRIREWPSAGYERRTLDDGRVEIDLEMVESRVEGQLESMGEAIRITETTAQRNPGTLTQQAPGEDFPAEFRLMRFISVDTPVGPLHNEEPIIIKASLTSIPPIARAEDKEGPNVFQAVNTPVPLLNESGEVVAHFSGSAETHDNCVVRMVEAESV
jgi:hypothetical protein